MEIVNESHGSEQESDEVPEERTGNHLRERRNLQSNHNKSKQTKHTNHVHTHSLTLNNGHYNYTQIPKPSQRPRSPKNSHNRMAEGIFILFYFHILNFYSFSIFHDAPHLLFTLA